MKDSLKERDYDVKSIENDPRLVRSRKEFFIALIIATVSMLAVVFMMYGINWGPVSEYKFITCVPAWCFFAVLAFLVFLVVQIIFALKGIKDVPLDDIDESESKEEDR